MGVKVVAMATKFGQKIALFSSLREKIQQKSDKIAMTSVLRDKSRTFSHEQ